jgi:exodeoxyribonuclease V alpha subunit
MASPPQIARASFIFDRIGGGRGSVCATGHCLTRFFRSEQTVPLPNLAAREPVEPEYPAVVIPVMTQHYAMLQRNLLYTGVTRGKRLVVLVGQNKAVAIAVRNVSGRRRWSKLQEWLSAGVSKHYVSA